MANQVTLTFAGETAGAEQAFDRVGASAEQMTVRVTQGTNEVAERFDYLSSQSSLLSGGIGDVGGALTLAFGEDNPIGQFGAEMERVGGIVMGFTGLMDLAVFATNNLKVATLAKAAADKVGAVRQWAMNSALLASPITWIIGGIVLLVAAIVLIATKTDWFSRAWRVSWKWVKDAASNTWEFLKKIPGWVGSAFAKVADYISRPYRAAFNAIARAWNSTIGRLSWSVPDWIPGIGGNSISVPNLPTFHAGGTVPGFPGEEVLIRAMAGEKVSATGRGGGGEIVIRGDGSQLADALVEIIKMAMITRNGDPRELGLRVAR
jgi:hypothetical protein